MGIVTSFTAAEKAELLRIARESVVSVVSGTKYVAVEPESSRLHQEAGAFVTLYLKGELKGCIGFIESRLPLYNTVAEVAAKSAVADPRFENVKSSELEDISIEISVLSPMQALENTDDLVVGRNGVMIVKGYSRGLLLPQVATENGWDREQFLSYVCLKAGLDKNAYKNPGAKVFVFTAEVFGDESQQKEENDLAKGT